MAFALAIEIGSALNTPRYWIDSPEMDRAMDAANDVVGWDNDIWSFIKEASVEKDITFNMVATISKFQGVNYQEAGQIVTKMMDQRIVDLDAGIADLKKITPPELERNFQAHKEALQSVVAGSHKWSLETPRYREYQIASQD